MRNIPVSDTREREEGEPIEREIVYFEARRPEDTGTTFGLVHERLKDSGVKLVVVGRQFDFRMCGPLSLRSVHP